MNPTEKTPVKELLKRLAADGVALFPDGADLRFRADHPIDAGTLGTLKERKPEILATLSPAPDCLTDQGREVYQEYVQEMLNPSRGPKLTLEAAESLAMELVSCFPGNLRENIKE